MNSLAECIPVGYTQITAIYNTGNITAMPNYFFPFLSFFCYWIIFKNILYYHDFDENIK